MARSAQLAAKPASPTVALSYCCRLSCGPQQRICLFSLRSSCSHCAQWSRASHSLAVGSWWVLSTLHQGSLAGTCSTAGHSQDQCSCSGLHSHRACRALETGNIASEALMSNRGDLCGSRIQIVCSHSGQQTGLCRYWHQLPERKAGEGHVSACQR